jgi:hypothetical protein
MKPTPKQRIARLLAVAAVIVVLPLAAGTTSATAAPAPPAPSATDGWVRLAHLSPDTAEVDIRLTSLTGTDVLYELAGVGYGVVSPYLNLPQGVYTVSMVPAGTSATATPMIRASVNVDTGSSITVAAYGKNSSITTKVFRDDLVTPASGKARIRLIQASTITPRVDVVTTTGLSIAKDATAGSVTDYTEVPSGPWDLRLTGSQVADDASVTLQNGSVTTLFVLDNSSGGLTILPVLDSSAAGAVPIGSVATGGGWLDSHPLGTPVLSR